MSKSLDKFIYSVIERKSNTLFHFLPFELIDELIKFIVIPSASTLVDQTTQYHEKLVNGKMMLLCHLITPDDAKHFYFSPRANVYIPICWYPKTNLLEVEGGGKMNRADRLFIRSFFAVCPRFSEN